MKKDQQQGSLITGLWKHKNAKGEDILIGRIGGNLNAVVVKNPHYKEGSRNPDFLLYFFNGRIEDINFNNNEEQFYE